MPRSDAPRLIWSLVLRRKPLSPRGRRRHAEQLPTDTSYHGDLADFFAGTGHEGGRVDAPIGGPGGGYAIDFERMTLETFVNEVLDGGFVLERLLEPWPSAALRAVDPERFAALDVKPTVLTVALRRPS